MNAITRLQAQHDALGGMMLRLVNLVEGFQGAEQAMPITVQLSKLAHLLRLHLATEDEWFYPAMMASGEPLAELVAASYREEVGGIAEEVEDFLRRWNSSAVIEIGFVRFRVGLLALLAKIQERIGREDHELYPLARQLGIGEEAKAAWPRAL